MLKLLICMVFEGILITSGVVGNKPHKVFDRNQLLFLKKWLSY
jgi:hypothetical protein